MDEEHCAIAVVGLKLRSSTEPQIKRRYNVFSICPAVLPRPPARQKSRRGSGQNDGAKVHIFHKTGKKQPNFFSEKV